MGFVGFAFLLDRYDEINPASLAIMWRQMSGQNLRHEWVPLRSISPALLRAVVAAEDGRFCVHRGVDWSELRAVMGQDGGPRRGASTITMQTARNLFLW
jgi:monofunctional biosynthetic peptidoglycan transglycosylase